MHLQAAERMKLRAALIAQYRGEDDDFSKEKANSQWPGAASDMFDKRATISIALY